MEPDSVEYLVAMAATAAEPAKLALAAELARQRLAAEPANLPLMLAWSLAAARSRRFDDVLALLRHAEGAGHPPEDLFNALNYHLLHGRDHATVAALAAALPGDHACRILARYFVACIAMDRRDIPAALDGFTAFRRALRPYMDVFDFSGRNELNKIFRQGTLVADAPTTARRLAETVLDPELAPGNPALIGAPPEQSPKLVFMTCCNGIYFDTMIERFLAGLMPHAAGRHVHVHVINPTDESRRLLDRPPHPAGLSATYSLEDETVYDTCSYFANRRFFFGPWLIRRFGAPVLSLDTDVTPTAALESILAAAAGHDIGVFDTGRNEPASVYQASFIYMADSPGSLAFLDMVQRFVGPRLAESEFITWLLDQSALLSVSNLCRAESRAVDFCVLNGPTGLAFEDAIRQITSDEENQDLKRKVWLRSDRQHLIKRWRPD